MRPSHFFSSDQKNLIRQAVADAELDTSGEIRVHIERRCKGEVLDRGAYLFKKLGMHKTAQRNGVLFYLAIDDHKFAILGDAGINAVTPEDFWDRIKVKIQEEFREGRFAEGLEWGIREAGKELLPIDLPRIDVGQSRVPVGACAVANLFDTGHVSEDTGLKQLVTAGTGRQAADLRANLADDAGGFHGINRPLKSL